MKQLAVDGPNAQQIGYWNDATGKRWVEMADVIDAQTREFDTAGFDLLFSRFRVMFFASPVEAFANLLVALRPGGRLVIVAWQALIRNPWMQLPIVAADKHLPPSVTPPDANAHRGHSLSPTRNASREFCEKAVSRIAGRNPSNEIC